MLSTPTQQFLPRPFDKEAELEATISEVKAALLGESRICLDVKKLIGERRKMQNIPDGYRWTAPPPCTSFARLQKAKTLDDVF